MQNNKMQKLMSKKGKHANLIYTKPAQQVINNNYYNLVNYFNLVKFIK